MLHKKVLEEVYKLINKKHNDEPSTALYLKMGFLKMDVLTYEKGPLTELIETINKTGIVNVIECINNNNAEVFSRIFKYNKIPCSTYKMYLFPGPFKHIINKIRPERYKYEDNWIIKKEELTEELERILQNNKGKKTDSFEDIINKFNKRKT